MPIKRRAVPGSILYETVGPVWSPALRHPVLQRFSRLERYELDAHKVEQAFLRSKGFRVVPAIDCSELDHVFLHAYSVVLYWIYGEQLYGDKAYRRLDKYLFHSIGSRMIHVGPVGREMYLTDLYHLRKDSGWKRKKRWKQPGYWHAISLGKNPSEHWVTTKG